MPKVTNNEEARAENAERIQDLAANRLQKFEHALRTEHIEFPERENVDNAQKEESQYLANANADLKRQMKRAGDLEDEALRKMRGG